MVLIIIMTLMIMVTLRYCCNAGNTGTVSYGHHDVVDQDDDAGQIGDVGQDDGAEDDDVGQVGDVGEDDDVGQVGDVVLDDDVGQVHGNAGNTGEASGNTSGKTDESGKHCQGCII